MIIRQAVTALVVIAAMSASAGPARAEDGAPPADCGPKAGLYVAAKGLRLWVTRRGEMGRENPLRPLSPERFVVLQVVVNGRTATAYGPNYDNLQQGGAPREIERDAADPIRWKPGADGLPPTLRVVGEDGAVLIDGMRFTECVEAPKARLAAPSRPPADPDKPNRKAAEERSRPRTGLPQGAMDGLSLPQRGTN